MSNTIRVRFAPSPTGKLHIGNVRTAILNWLFARNSGGTFVLRIEDTDAERSTEESERHIIDQLKWLGLDWDEGPVKGGPFGPYRQSDRQDLHREHVKRLLTEGKAYHCYLTKEELEVERKSAIAEKRQPDYFRFARDLTPEREAELREQGIRPVVRFRIPPGSVQFTDLIQGDVSFQNESFVDFVIQRQDGSSPYNFAAVVDDALMQITHVVRGDDHLSNTPKQVMLYEAFGYDVPEFAHTPMIMGPDGSRLSKRHGHTSVEEFREAGYLPEALLNFLSLLSWSSESGDELLSRERLIEEFSFDRMSRSPAKFDRIKLNWMNGQYIRALSPEERIKHAAPYLEEAGMTEADSDRLRAIVEALKDKVETFSEYPGQAELFFTDDVTITGSDALDIIGQESAKKVLAALRKELDGVEDLTLDSFKAVMKSVQKETGIKGKDLWMPVRVALTGKTHGPELPAVIEIFGREKCKKLLDDVVN